MTNCNEEYLADKANRCLLILIGSSQLVERECLETLSFYGSVKKINLTPERRAAFVEFECVHGPLLFARCFAHIKNGGQRFRLVADGKTIEELPMPRGVDTLLPACSMDKFLYLHKVPRIYATADIREHFSKWCGERRTVKVYRPEKPKWNSPRVVVELDGKEAAEFHNGKIITCDIEINKRIRSFVAIPSLLELSDTSNIFESGGCEECNTELFKVIEDPVQIVEGDRDASTVADTRAIVQPPYSQPEEKTHEKHEVLSSKTLKLFSRAFPALPDYDRWDDVPEAPDPIPWKTNEKETKDIQVLSNTVPAPRPFPILPDGYAPQLRYEGIRRAGGGRDGQNLLKTTVVASLPEVQGVHQQPGRKGMEQGVASVPLVQQSSIESQQRSKRTLGWNGISSAGFSSIPRVSRSLIEVIEEGRQEKKEMEQDDKLDPINESSNMKESMEEEEEKARRRKEEEEKKRKEEEKEEEERLKRSKEKSELLRKCGLLDHEPLAPLGSSTAKSVDASDVIDEESDREEERTDDVVYEKEEEVGEKVASEDFDDSSLLLSDDDEDVRRRDVDSDDLLSGEEDPWTPV